MHLSDACPGIILWDEILKGKKLKAEDRGGVCPPLHWKTAPQAACGPQVALLGKNGGATDLMARRSEWVSSLKPLSTPRGLEESRSSCVPHRARGRWLSWDWWACLSTAGASAEVRATHPQGWMEAWLSLEGSEEPE